MALNPPGTRARWGWSVLGLGVLVSQCTVVSLPNTNWPCRSDSDCLAAFQCRDYLCLKPMAPSDAGPGDAGQRDAGLLDGGVPDAGVPDAGRDAGSFPDGGAYAPVYLVVWEQWFPDAGDFHTWGRLIGSDGGLAGPPFRIDDMFGARAWNTLAIPVGIDGGYALTSNAANVGDGGATPSLQVLYMSPDGTPLGANAVAKTPYSAAISSSGSALAVGWTEPNFVSGLAALRTTTWPPKTQISPFLLDAGATVGVTCAKTACLTRLSWFGVPHQIRPFDLVDGGVGAPYVFPPDAGDYSLWAATSDGTKFFVAQGTDKQIILRPFSWAAGVLTTEPIRAYPISVRAFFGASMGFACSTNQCLLAFQTSGSAGLSVAVMPTGAFGTASTFVLTEHDARDSTVAVHGDQFVVAYEGPPTSPGIYIKILDPPYSAPTTVPGTQIAAPLAGHLVKWPQGAGLP